MTATTGSALMTIGGAALVILSAVLASVIVERRERTRKKLESELDEQRQALLALWEWEHASQQKTATADVLLSVIRLGTMPVEMRQKVNRRVAHWIYTALSDRHSSATGEQRIPRERLTEWETLLAAAENGEAAPLQRMVDMHNEYLPVSVKRVLTLRARIAELAGELTDTEQKIASIRYWSVALQILGLIIALARDLAA
jgi:hypothetical protein